MKRGEKSKNLTVVKTGLLVFKSMIEFDIDSNKLCR
jgi:hypothetical protein